MLNIKILYAIAILTELVLSVTHGLIKKYVINKLQNPAI